jgi:sortase A
MNISQQGQERHDHRRRVVTRILIVGGISLVVIGVLIAAGVRIYIWGTNRSASQYQEDLFRQWEESPVDPTAPGKPAPLPGEPALRIVIPSIEVDAIVVELASMDDLESLSKGPGHIPGTAYPGQPGNVVLSGHRTTFGAPFRRINELVPGDEIFLYTASGKYVYTVSEQVVVEPTDLSVLDQSGEPRLTLASCHPEFSARQRIVVVSLLRESEAFVAVSPE